MADAKIGATVQVVKGTGVVPGQGVAAMWKVFTTEPVAATATVDSWLGAPCPVNRLGFLLMESHYFGLWIQLAGTAPDVKVQILQSWDDVAADYGVTETTGTVVASLTDTDPHIYALSPAAMPFMRIRLVGNLANGTDTTVTAYLWQQA